MSSKEIVTYAIEKNNGIAKVSDMVNDGASRQDIKKLYADGYIQRVSQGYYQLTSNTYLPDEQIIASTIPKSVVCLESALFYYGYSDFTPRKIAITIPRSSSRRAIIATEIPLLVYYVSD